MRYGENNHQQAWFYEDVIPKSFSISQAKQLHGKQLSYNNIKDADAASRIIREFEPTTVGLKHMNHAESVAEKQLKRPGTERMKPIQFQFLVGSLHLTGKLIWQQHKSYINYS